MSKEKEESLKKQRQKPAGWDSEDEYIEKVYSRKKEDKPQIQRIDNTKLNYTCPKCKYKFVYDEEKETPSLCPYCGKKVAAQFGF